MMFADDTVICSESREQVEENLKRWRFALERRGMKVSRSKTEYMCVNEMEGSGTVRLQSEEVKKVQEFKYLESTVQSNGECGKEVKKRVQAGWNGWRKVSGVLCDRKISARIKGKVYETVVRAAMLYGLETVALRKRQEAEREVAELKMLRFSLGVTRLDRIRNGYIRGTAHVGRLGDKVREARLRWFGHVQRREREYIGRRCWTWSCQAGGEEEGQRGDAHWSHAPLLGLSGGTSACGGVSGEGLRCKRPSAGPRWDERPARRRPHGPPRSGGLADLEKAYDRVPREELWYCMRKSRVAEKYVRVVQDMYERSRTVVRCAVGQTEEFKVEVGLHQGSALSPFLFAMVMDQLSEEVRQESPCTMMFADDIVICSESRVQVEENLERWREGSGTVRLQGEEVKKVQEFKYLGSTVQSNGECGKEVKKRVQAGWNGWGKVSGVLCDRKISVRIKGKVYETVVRAAMLYGLETVSLRKRQESELEVAELKMLRFSLGVTRLDRIRNENIRGTAHVGRLGDKVREARLRWFGHVQRRESEYISRRMLDMELPGRR
ncbi:hypothetical protein PDJAM_G00257550 [Pangasius djambal]|uniref:Uncharacterized protein n=1 Tax=Pangasius djambal TaxID=1691987 RepID=A0ACC5YKZ8_9TELE|nr:hypothetical protein [Pangasius djambal]